MSVERESSQPEPTVSAPTEGLPAQRLSELTGVSPAMERQLHARGYTRFFQLAHWSDETIVEMSGQLGVDPAQIRSANWVGQARRRG